MEFLRFGSSIPGSYWGCCAVDIIQNFKCSPDEKASIAIVSGDSSTPCVNSNLEPLFAGTTYRDIFMSRLRFGTFSKRDMPNHAFMAVLTHNQINTGFGKEWLKILKETGFEFIRSVSNSVYTGAEIDRYSADRGNNRNYIFMLVRNIGSSGDGDSLTPPDAWIDLPDVVTEAWGLISGSTRKQICKDQHRVHTEVWDKIGPPKFYTEKELDALDVPVIYAGICSESPQESREARQAKQKTAFKPASLAAFS